MTTDPQLLVATESASPVVCERSGDWVNIWLNRPEVKNALSNEVFLQLRDVFLELHEDTSVRGVTLRGKGGVFCAGGDLRMFRDIFQGVEVDASEVEASSQLYAEVYRLLDTLPQFVLALVEGAAVAGGLGLVAAADMVAVTEDARFALTETTLGIPPAQIAPFVVRALGPRQARRLMLSASRFDGLEAVAMGLADVAVKLPSELDAVEAGVRRRVRRCAPEANAITKSLLATIGTLDDAEFIQQAARAYTRCMLGDEGIEGVSAFFDKRLPEWAQECSERTG